MLHKNDQPGSFRNKRVLIVGLGRFGGGVGVTRYLANQGAHVRISDMLPEDDLKDSIRQLDGVSFELCLGGHESSHLDDIDIAVINPAISPFHPFIAQIIARNIPMTTEVNIFFEQCLGKIIGIIGTNGKESIVRMIEKMFQIASIPHIVGGNMGTSLLEQLDQIQPETYVLFELSSFQLERLPWISRRPEIVVYNTISPNHLDWHGSLEAYVQAKLNALVGHGSSGVAVINIDDPILRTAAPKVEGRLVSVSMNLSHQGITVSGDTIISRDHTQETVLSTTHLSAPGKHNLYNALMAAGVGSTLGLTREAIEPALTSFNGVPHALQFAGKKRGVLFYNDSAATNVEATLAAIKSFDNPLWIILGGYDKKIDYSNLVEALNSPKILGIATIGSIGEKLAHQIAARYPGVRVNYAQTLDRAFTWITSQVKPDEIVLLSPATSSYDQFSNLEERGDTYISLVEQYGA